MLISSLKLKEELVIIFKWVINEGKNHPQLLWSKIFQHLHISDFNFDLILREFLSSDGIHFSKHSHSSVSRGTYTCPSAGFPKGMLQGHRSAAHPILVLLESDFLWDSFMLHHRNRASTVSFAREKILSCLYCLCSQSIFFFLTRSSLEFISKG